MSDLTPEERIAQLEREVADRRETNTRLNRRCQAQESYVMRREMRRVWRHVGDLYYGVVIGRRDAIRAAVLRERERASGFAEAEAKKAHEAIYEARRDGYPDRVGHHRVLATKFEALAAAIRGRE